MSLPIQSGHPAVRDEADKCPFVSAKEKELQAKIENPKECPVGGKYEAADKEVIPCPFVAKYFTMTGCPEQPQISVDNAKKCGHMASGKDIPCPHLQKLSSDESTPVSKEVMETCPFVKKHMTQKQEIPCSYLRKYGNMCGCPFQPVLSDESAENCPYMKSKLNATENKCPFLTTKQSMKGCPREPKITKGTAEQCPHLHMAFDGVSHTETNCVYLAKWKKMEGCEFRPTLDKESAMKCPHVQALVSGNKISSLKHCHDAEHREVIEKALCEDGSEQCPYLAKRRKMDGCAVQPPVSSTTAAQCPHLKTSTEAQQCPFMKTQ